MKQAFHLSLGDRGEMIGWNYLREQGYQIIEKNYRCKIGEIDVIAKKNHRLVFIEIKTRSSAYFGEPEEAVHLMKQRKLIQLAKWYLKDKRIEETAVCFDVLSIIFSGVGEPKIRLIENAFHA